MKQGYIRVHTSKVQRAAGHSSVGAAAYQSRQELTHEQQRHSSLTLEHRKDLNKERLTDALRAAFHEPEKVLVEEKKNVWRIPEGITLSEDATITKDTVTIIAKDENGHEVEKEKIKRGHWTITDSDQTYRIKEHRHRVTNPETGKQESTYHLDVYADRTHDYTTKEKVELTWLQRPHAPQEATSVLYDPTREQRQAAWNTVEKQDVNRDAVTAIKVELTFLRDLSLPENIALAHEFIQHQFTNQGYFVDAAVHRKQASDGERNDHIHLLVATRPLLPDGTFAEDKQSLWNQGLNDRQLANRFRYAWANLQNATLQRNGCDVRVDPRSHKARGLEQEPSAYIGKAAWNQEQQHDENGTPIRTPGGDKNREVKRRNDAKAFGKEEAPFTYSQEAIDGYYERRWQQDSEQYEGDYQARAKQQEAQAQARRHKEKQQEERIKGFQKILDDTYTNGDTQQRHQWQRQWREDFKPQDAREKAWQQKEKTAEAWNKNWHKIFDDHDAKQKKRERRTSSNGFKSRAKAKEQQEKIRFNFNQKHQRPLNREDKRRMKPAHTYGRTIKNQRDRAYFYAHFNAVMLKREQEARRAIFDRMVGKAASVRERHISQDRPKQMERERERQRQQGSKGRGR